MKIIYVAIGLIVVGAIAYGIYTYMQTKAAVPDTPADTPADAAAAAVIANAAAQAPILAAAAQNRATNAITNTAATLSHRVR
jgi:hypothetical protein